MVLAGILGALLVESLPLSVWVSQAPNEPSLIALSALASLLPMPIGLDVMLASALQKAGLDEAY